jgi:hypothetical protein
MKISAMWTILAVLVTLTACGGEGGRRIGGQRCPNSYNPVDMAAKKAKLKVDAKANDFSELPAGTYKYAGAELYYSDRGTRGKILLTDVRRGAKESTDFNPKISCVRNYLSLQRAGGISVSVSGVSDFILDDNHSMTSFEVKDYGFEFKNGHRKDEFKKADSKPGTFKEVYNNIAETAFVIKINETRYQIRSYYPGSKKHGDTYLLILLDYSKPVASP